MLCWWACPPGTANDYYEMATGDLMACELLCYLMNKYGNSPNDSLKSVVLSFYSPIEIASAKDTIYKAVAPLTVDGLPRLVQRRKGDDKPRHDVDDIFTLVDALDDRALLGSLPKYVAGDLSRVPPLNTGDLDMTLLTLRVSAMEKKMSQLVGECVAAVQMSVPKYSVTTVQNPDPIASTSGAADGVNMAPLQDRNSPLAHDVLDKDDKDGAMKSSNVNTSWTDVVNRNKAKQPKPTPSTQHRFLGKGSASATNRPSIKAVPRKLQAFVSRLDLNTTADDLVSWFGSVGIPDVKCYKLDPPEGRTFTTAAFKVSCDVGYEQLFYDEANWPEGCDVRDWYVSNKSPPQSGRAQPSAGHVVAPDPCANDMLLSS